MHSAIQRVSRYLYNRSAGLLLIRVTAGAVFLANGLQKVGDMSTTITAFDAFGFSPLIAVFIAWLEIIGGISLIFGIAPRLFGGILGIEMLVAAYLVSEGRGLLAAELELLLAAISLGIMLVGSGRYALYTMECDKCGGMFCIRRNGVCIMPA